MHLGTIVIEHPGIEPMGWIHVANRIVMSSSTSISRRTSVLSALFGGMIKAANRYEASERDLKAAEAAVCLLSTLHVVLETDMARDSQAEYGPMRGKVQQRTQPGVSKASSGDTTGTTAISHAARSFLGERVVAAEEDGDEGRIAARTVYQACEEYAERAGEPDGMMGLLARLFASAARHYHSESTDESVVSISEGTLPGHPEESDTSSDSPNVRSESPPFTLDVFDQRSKDGCAASATIGSNSEAGADPTERVELHREVAALSLDTLAHWVSRADSLGSREGLDMREFVVNICKSASFFSLRNSPASYDLHAAMVDFGSLVGPLIFQQTNNSQADDKPEGRAALVFTLITACQKMNPILKRVLSFDRGVSVVRTLAKALLEKVEEDRPVPDQSSEASHGLPVDDLVSAIMTLLSAENAVDVVEILCQYIKAPRKVETANVTIAHRAACLIVLSRAINVTLGILDDRDATRVAIAALYNRDVDHALDPVFPHLVAELVPEAISDSQQSPIWEPDDRLLASLHGITKSVDRMCFHPSFGSWGGLSDLATLPTESVVQCSEVSSQSTVSAKLCFHLFWGSVMLHRALASVAKVTSFTFTGLCPLSDEPASFPLSSPFVCMNATESKVGNDRLRERLDHRQKSSIPLLYTAECLAFLHPQTGMRSDEQKVFADHDLLSLISSLVKNIVDIVSDHVCPDEGSTFKALHRAFRKDFVFDSEDRVEEETELRRQIRPAMTRDQTSYACLQLAMAYMRDIGSNQIAQLLGTVMVSVSHFLARLNPQQLEEARDLMVDVSKLLLFLPDAFGKLGCAIRRYLKLCIKLSFGDKITEDSTVEAMVLFLARLAGFSKAMDVGASSGPGIHLLCEFAHDSSAEDFCEANVLQLCLTSDIVVPEDFSKEFVAWLQDVFPKVRLRALLANLMILPDESAVAVSAHSQSLSLLSEACQLSKFWKYAVVADLYDLLLDRDESFVTKLVRHSVMDSATMNESVLAIFERVIGAGDDESSAKVIVKVFESACQLFREDVDSSLESRVRLMTFMVRLATSHRLIVGKVSKTPSRSLMEPLFELTIGYMREMMVVLKETDGSDESAKRKVLFLCGLVDSFLDGIYGPGHSYTSQHGDPSRPFNQGQNADPDGNGSAKPDENERKSSTNSIPSDLDISAGNSTKSLLCTYTTTGSQFVEQHWYFCYSCDLTGSEGVCSVCARVCHDGCELAFSKFSRFFCDCGAGSDPQHENASNAMSASEDGEGGNLAAQDGHSQTLSVIQGRRRKLCKCLKSFPSRGDSPSSTHGSEDRKLDSIPECEHDVLSELRLRELLHSEIRTAKEEGPKSEPNSVPTIQESFERVMKSAETARCLIHTALVLVCELQLSHSTKNAVCLLPEEAQVAESINQAVKTPQYVRMPRTTKIARSTRVFKAGCFDMNGMPPSAGSPIIWKGSLISYSSSSSILAIAQKTGKVQFIDVSETLQHTGNPLEKAIGSSYAQTSVPYDIFHLVFHPENPNLLLVVGSTRVSVLVRVPQSGGCRWHYVEIELGLVAFDSAESGSILLDASWVEGKAAYVLITTTNFVKVFDVTKDNISPCFFAKTPGVNEAGASVGVHTNDGEEEIHEPNSTKAEKIDECSGRTVRCAFVVPRLVQCETQPILYLVLITSDNLLFVSRCKVDEADAPKFLKLCDLGDTIGDEIKDPSINGVFYHPTTSLIMVSFKNGSLVGMALALEPEGEDFRAATQWVHFYSDAIPAGDNAELIPVPGLETIFMFCRKGQSLKSGGVLSVTSDRSMKIHCFSGSPSSSVLGLTTYAPSSVLGRSAFAGGFILLDDGSLHRVDVACGPPRPQISDQSILSTVFERQRQRALRASRAHNDGLNGYHAVPDTVGFFEKCRLVSEQVQILPPFESSEPGPLYERMGVILAGSSGDCVVSSKENESFDFSAAISNQSIVLVGARLRFGGSERSRNRVPLEVKVFGRTVRWQAKNGVKRWLDIPFTVPESTESPQKAHFELLPRRTMGESRFSGDGYLAIDSLELYAVSTIEFTERKLLYENEEAKHYEQLKKQREPAEERNVKKYSELLSMASRGTPNSPNSAKFSQEQVALLSLLNSLDSKSFAKQTGAEAESGTLLLEINNLWSAVFEGSPARDPNFLGHMLKPVLKLCTGSEEADALAEFASNTKELMSKAVISSTDKMLCSVGCNGVLLHVNDIERSLFAVGGLCRSLLVAASSVGKLDRDTWKKTRMEVLPPPSSLYMLLKCHFGLGPAGRSLFTSSYAATTCAVDIFMVEFVRGCLEPEDETLCTSSMFFSLLIQMLCSFDQRLRLFISQRLLELFDSLDAAAELTGTPLEAVVGASLSDHLRTAETSTEHPSSSSETENTNEETESAQRWAYRCDNCREVCDQEWWHCNVCEDFDLCTGCLRKPGISFDGQHNEEHLLLRGTAGDDLSSQESVHGNDEVSDVTLAVQKALGSILDEILSAAASEKSSSNIWRYLDGIETVSQLVGKRSHPLLKSFRVESLFQSTFVNFLRRESENVGNEIEGTSTEAGLRTIPKNMELLFLVLRIANCAQGGLTPTFLHECSIPASLVRLLRKFHGKLQILVRSLISGQLQLRKSPAEECSLVSWGTWNNLIPGLAYDVLHQRRSLRPNGKVGALYYLNEELGQGNSLFLNLLIAVLEVLEYSFKSASSSSILTQMSETPRNVLCDIINFCESTYPYVQDTTLLKESARAATRVLSALSFDDVNVLNDTLDKYLYEEQCQHLENAVKSMSGNTNQIVEYDVSVEIATILETLHKAAETHPATWRSFVIENDQVLRHIYGASRLLGGQMRVKALQLLATGFAVSDKVASRVIQGLRFVDFDDIALPNSSENPAEAQDDGNVEHEDEPETDCVSAIALSKESQHRQQVAVSIFQEKSADILQFLVHKVMLRSQDAAARRAASHIIILGIARAAAHVEEESFVTTIHSSLMKGIHLMPYAGELSDGLLDCVQFFIKCCQGDLFDLQSEPLLTSLSFTVTSLMKQRCNLLVSHPNARLYGRLSALLDINGYYLESDPCMSCSGSVCASSESTECRLDTIRAETKYTDSSIMHRLLSVHEVSAISVKVVDPRRTRRAKTIDVLFSSRSVADAAELKSVDFPWRKLRSLELDSKATEASINLVVPIAAANIKLEFVDFHSLAELPSESSSGNIDKSSAEPSNSRRSNSNTGSNENLQCPRCSRSVTDRHGICRNCHENAYQCRQCRNINYENLDGFLCNECGYCKHGRFEFSVIGRPTFVAERIANEEDRKRASKIIEKETGNVHRCMDQLTSMRSSIIRSLNSGIPTEEGRERTKLLGNARVGLADLLDSVAPRAEIAVLEALLEQGHAPQEIEEAANSTQGGISITEEVAAESSGSADRSDRDQNNDAGSSVASPVNRNDPSRSASGDGNVISKSTTALATTYGKECRSIYTGMSRGIRVLTLTRAELVRYANSVGGSRLQYANEIVLKKSLPNTDDIETDSATSGLTRSIPNQRRVACYGCTQSFVSHCVRLVQCVLRRDGPATTAIRSSDLCQYILLVCSLCEKPEVRGNMRDLITYLVNDNLHATQLVCRELSRKIEFCVDSFETVDSHSVARFEMGVLEAIATLDDSCWEERLKLVIRILFKSSTQALTCSSVSESIILPCLRVALRLMRTDYDLMVIDSKAPAEEFSGSHDTGDVERPSGHSTGPSDGEPVDDSRSGRNTHTSQPEASSDGDIRRTSEQDGSGVANTSIGSLEAVRSRISHIPDNSEQSSSTEPTCTQTTASNLENMFSTPEVPSSIGGESDLHDSGDEENNTAPRPRRDISAEGLSTLLENDHESKVVTADVDRWLEGKFDQRSWIAEMTERSNGQEGGNKRRTGPSQSRAHLGTVFSRWKHLGADSSPGLFSRKDKPKLKPLSIEKDNWVVRLMLLTPCATVRKEACALLELICGHEETLQLQLLDVLTGPAISLGADAGEHSKEFFDLLERSLSSRSHRLYLIAKGFLSRLADLIRTRAERLLLSEASSESSLQLVNFLEGYAVKRLLSLLRHTLDAIPGQRLSLREKLFKVNDYKLVGSLERAYICMRKLISLRTKLTDECGAQLCEILLSRDLLFAGPSVLAVVSACVEELKTAKARKDAQAIGILLEQLCLMLCPERKEPICHLSLKKAPTQEEYIRGSMSRNPYASSTFDGPLMRDVKNKICRDLEIPSLLDDDFAMELLVAGNLVKLDLPIMAVYDHVWRGSSEASMVSNMQPTQLTRSFGLRRTSHTHPSRGQVSRRSTILTLRRLNSDRDVSEDDSRSDGRADPPMVVVYRLSGLDGEATEPIVDSVPAESNDEEDAEKMYGDTIVFGEVGGLEVLFQLLAIVGSWGDDAETAVRAPALRLLRASCEVAKNRALLAKSADTVSTLLDCAASAFEHAQGSPTAVSSAESLLVAAEQILAQQRKELESHASTMTDTVTVFSHDPDEIMSRIQVFLGRLSVATSPKAENSILHLLPFLVQGVPSAIGAVLQYFQFACETIDVESEGQRKARQLGTVLLATPKDLRGDKFAEQTIRTDVAMNAVQYLVRKFPVPRNTHQEDWAAALEYPGPPLVLRLLTGLSLFFGPGQDQYQSGILLKEILGDETKIIPALCQLEMAVSGNAIGTTTEELLDALGKDGKIKSEIERERSEIKRARREAAKASRMAILRETGLSKLVRNETPTSQLSSESVKKGEEEQVESVLKLMDELPDEVGPSCVVCGDGFRCRPEDALAFYVHCRKVPLDLAGSSYASKESGPGETSPSGSAQNSGRLELQLWASGRSRNHGTSTRTGGSSCYATVTHLNAIHLSCHKEAARADRSSRRDEWEGAALRNSQTKCNNLFPVRPPVTLEKEAGDDQAAIQKTARMSYSAAVDSYFGRLSSIGRTNLSHSKVVIYDIGRSLLRFADGGTMIFSEYARGGGPHSNACLLPHLVQLAIHMVEVSPHGEQKSFFDESRTLQTQEAALVKFVEEDEVGDVTYYLASALVLQSLEKWSTCATVFLRRGIRGGALRLAVLLRLIAFTDLVNRVMKSGVSVADDQHWLESFRRRIGSDEAFAQEFGDIVNNRWEEYIRSVDDAESLSMAISRNYEVDNMGHGGQGKALHESMKLCIESECSRPTNTVSKGE
ncbi:unnamed protein product [Chondrus crispus]|uniref:ZZ-type domain-containing protein n=1 Tax=Chondrus crispus TaxID=2769 RepID=R7QCM5_CHOCR|nr:unnamed protein product [Chondrus crispus]CDF35829.1 unnamed protein product [Chondrus crispus]|eukprot:XP_005715648.1 unnamed protein product [Chondrus crispus]